MCLKMSAVLAISGSDKILELGYLFIQAVNILSKKIQTNLKSADLKKGLAVQARP